VQVTDAELGEAMRAEAMRYGDQAQQIFDLLRNNPNIQATMRAPIYEDKVVDYILEQATVTDRPVSKEDLLKEDDLPEGFETAAEPKAKAPAKTPKVAGKTTAKAKTEEASQPDAPEAEAPAPKPAKARKVAKPVAAAEATTESADTAVKAKPKVKTAKS
jgi:hypothetical protein